MALPQCAAGLSDQSRVVWFLLGQRSERTGCPDRSGSSCSHHRTLPFLLNEHACSSSVPPGQKEQCKRSDLAREAIGLSFEKGRPLQTSCLEGAGGNASPLAFCWQALSLHDEREGIQASSSAYLSVIQHHRT